MTLSRKRITIGIIVLALMLAGISFLIIGYNIFLAPAMNLQHGETRHIYIKSDWGFEETMQMLEDEDVLRYPRAFRELARFKEYPSLVRAGRFKITSEMSNRDLVTLLRIGKQDPVNVIFNNIRTPQQLAGRIARQIEADSVVVDQCFYRQQLPSKVWCSEASTCHDVYSEHL
jgi:UPF0755 protein